MCDQRYFLATRDFAGVAGSAAASSLGLSNVYFWRTTEAGYFATDTRKLPLLHTWSVGAILGVSQSVGDRSSIEILPQNPQCRVCHVC